MISSCCIAWKSLVASVKTFILLCCPAGHVAIDSSGMLIAASGPRVEAVGDTFVVQMDREYPLGRS